MGPVYGVYGESCCGTLRCLLGNLQELSLHSQSWGAMRILEQYSLQVLSLPFRIHSWPGLNQYWKYSPVAGFAPNVSSDSINKENKKRFIHFQSILFVILCVKCKSFSNRYCNSFVVWMPFNWYHFISNIKFQLNFRRMHKKMIEKSFKCDICVKCKQIAKSWSTTHWFRCRGRPVCWPKQFRLYQGFRRQLLFCRPYR